MNIVKLLSLGLLLSTHIARADIFEQLGIKQSDTTVDVVLGNEKKSEIVALQSDIAAIEEKEKKFWQDNQHKFDKYKAEIEQLEQEIKTSFKDIDFANKRLIFLKTIKQIFSSFRSVWRETISIQKQHRDILEGYVKDPEFSVLRLQKKSFYTFDDLQEFNEQVAALEEKIKTLHSEYIESQTDFTNHKKKLASVEALYKEKHQEQADLIAKSAKIIIPEGMSSRQYGYIIDLQVVLGEYEKELILLRIKKEEAELAHNLSRSGIAKKRMQVVRNNRDLMTRMLLRVDENDLVIRREKLATQKREYFNVVELYGEKVDALSLKEEILKEGLQHILEANHAVFEGRTLSVEWSMRPSTSEGFVALANAGLIQEKIFLSKREEDFSRVQIDASKAELDQEELMFDTIQTWFKITHKRFRTSEEFSRELKKYSTLVSSFERDREVYEEKRRVASAKLNIQNKSLADIKELLHKVELHHFSSKEAQENKNAQDFLNQAIEIVAKQVGVTSKLIESYSKLLMITNQLIWQINTMIDELERASLWHRSSGAISREGISNLIPDIKNFIADVHTLWFAYVAEFSLSELWESAAEGFKDLWFVFLLLVKLFIVGIVFVFFKRHVLILVEISSKVNKEIWWVYLLSLFFSMTFEFVHKYFISIFIWLLLYVFFGWSPLPTIPSIFFFLLSIPYFLFMSRRFVSYWAQFNGKNNCIFFSESFEERFVPFLRWLFYTTVVIFPFREAFILATYSKSELPDILFALYSIILRVLLLALIQKEDLLSLIPSKTAFGNWVWRLVNNYYYILLCGFIILMIMMDPHIGGYNKLVFYLVWGTISTFIAIKVAIELYALCRRASSILFFSSDGEVLKERFQLSRTLYGASVIVLFVLFLLFGFFTIAWVWGRPVSWQAVGDFLNTERLTLEASSGQFRKLSIVDLAKAFSFIPLGIVAGWIVDWFIVNRIFSVLLVKPGVQNAISTITYYFVVVSFITISLWGEGFGFIIAILVAPVLLGIAWSLRDVFNDFVAYFVILIQRPLKVGDYIKLDEETAGVVRTISPRSVVLRRKRGFSVIVPNSRIIRETLTNWDYNLNFISCPDIIVHIPYSYGAERARAVLAQAVDRCVQVLKVPGPVIRLDHFADHGYMFMIRVYTSPENTLLQWDIASDVRLSVDKVLREQSMEVAVPTRIIKMYKDEDWEEKTPPNTPGSQD